LSSHPESPFIFFIPPTYRNRPLRFDDGIITPGDILGAIEKLEQNRQIKNATFARRSHGKSHAKG
jgi:hypothetical protein